MHGYGFTPARLTLVTAIVLVCCQALRGEVVPGHVEAWGYNFSGQATPPGELDGVIAVAGGNDHSLALRTNGTVVAWGSNHGGESTVPAGLSNVVAIAASGFSAALKADGRIVVWGTPAREITNAPPEATNLVGIALGQQAVFALRRDGRVIAWGHQSSGETNVPPGLANVIQVAAGSYHALALTESGAIIGWGGNENGEALHPAGLTNVIQVRGGQQTSVALKEDGTLFKWGGSFDSNDVPAGVTGVVDFDLGFQHGLALRSDGTVFAWGVNFLGQGSVPSNLNGVTAISAGGNHNLVVTARPIITSITPPVSTSAGANVILTVAASGEPLRYQWQHNGTNLPAGTNASLTIRSINSSQVGNYRVYVNNGYGYNSAETFVTFGASEPESRTVHRGETVVLSIAASGAAPLAYQWFRNGTAIAGQTNATFLASTSSGDDSATYRVIVTDATGKTKTSGDARITVIDPRPGAITLNPVLDTSIHSSGANPQGASTILAGRRQNGILDRGLLRFDVATIPTNAVVESAELRLQLFRQPRSAVGSTFWLYRVLKGWGAEANWINATNNAVWSMPGGEAGVDYVTNGIPGFLTFSSSAQMLADINLWVQDPATNHGWFLISAGEATPLTAKHFYSSESSLPPQLVINFSVSAEAPAISSARRESTNFVFDINGQAGWFYNVQHTAELGSGVWTTFTNAPAGAALEPIIITVPMSSSQQFFRAFRN